MKKQSNPALDVRRLAVVVLFLIIAIVYARTFVHYYFHQPAQAAKKAERGLETARAIGASALPTPPPPGTPLYEWSQQMTRYITTGDEQAKQWLIQDTKKLTRARYRLAIWGSLAVVCVSVIIVVGVGLPMLLERRA